MKVLVTMLGFILPAFVGLVLTPRLIRDLGLENFGILSMLYATYAASGSLDFGLGRGFILLVEAQKSRGSVDSLKKTLNTCMLIVTVAGAVFSLLFLSVMVVSLSFRVNAIVEEKYWFLLSSFLLISMVSVFPATISRFRLDAIGKFGTTSSLRALFGSLYFIIPSFLFEISSSWDLALASVFLVRIVHSAAQILLAYACTNLPSDSSCLFDRRIAVDLIKESYWMFIPSVVGFFISIFDKALIGRYLGLDSVAVYATPSDIISRLSIVPSSVVTVLFPRFAQLNYNLEDSHRRERNIAFGFSVCIGLTSLVSALILLPVSYFSDILLRAWLQVSYVEEMGQIARIACVGFFANFSSYVLVAHLNSIGKSKDVTITLVIEIVAMTLVFFLLSSSISIVDVSLLISLRMILDWMLLHIISLKSRAKVFGFTTAHFLEVVVPVFSLFSLAAIEFFHVY